MNRRWYPWMLVGLLWVVALLNYLDRQVLFSVFPLLQTDLALSAAQLGMLSTVFLFVYAGLSPFAGYLADRWGRARVILVSLLVWSVVTWLTGHARNYGELVGARALMGISEAFYLPAALGLIADYHGPRSRSLATGLHQSGLYAGIVFGGAAGGWLGEHYGWRFAFTLLGAAGVLYFCVLRIALRKRSPEGEQAAGEYPRVLSSFRTLLCVPGFLRMAGVFSAVSVANWLVYTWLPLYLYERFHMSLTGAGFSATFYVQIASFAGILVGGWMADFWTRRSERGRVSTQVVGLLASAPFLFLIGFTGSYPTLVLALVVFGLGRGLYDCNAMPVMCQVVSPQLRSTGYGIFNFSACIAGGIAAGAAGYLKSAFGLHTAFQAAAVLLLISAAVLIRVPVRKDI